MSRSLGPWRVAVVERSMRPTIEAGDWLLVDPIVRRWPRRGTIVVFHEPESDVLAIKRVAAVPGDVVKGVRVTDPETGTEVEVTIRLTPDEAWLLGDDPAVSIDSRRYGPVPLERLVGRAWFRYAPLRRVGFLGHGSPGGPGSPSSPADLGPGGLRPPGDARAADPPP